MHAFDMAGHKRSCHLPSIAKDNQSSSCYQPPSISYQIWLLTCFTSAFVEGGVGDAVCHRSMLRANGGLYSVTYESTIGHLHDSSPPFPREQLPPVKKPPIYKHNSQVTHQHLPHNPPTPNTTPLSITPPYPRIFNPPFVFCPAFCTPPSLTACPPPFPLSLLFFPPFPLLLSLGTTALISVVLRLISTG